MRRFTPAQVLQETRAPYAILWHLHKELVVPAQVYGDHSFMRISKCWKFNYGEGCVGRAYAKHEIVIIENTSNDGDKAFLRREIAEECGIRVVALVPLENGGILEVGYDHMPSNLWMHNILAMWAKRQEIERDSMSRILRIRTPSPECLIEYQVKQPDEGKTTSLETFDTQGQQLKSIGSAAHPHGCTECFFFFFHTSGCKKGKDCCFCHEVHPRKKTRKNKQIQNRLQASLSKPNEEDSTRAGLDTAPAYFPQASEPCPPAELVQPQRLLMRTLEQHVPAEPALTRSASEPRLAFQGHSATGTKCSIADRLPLAPVQESKQSAISQQARAELDLPHQEIPSIGSRGHPNFCGGACKYNKLRKGCKEGASCSRCHLCAWSRQSERTLLAQRQIQKQAALDSIQSAALSEDIFQ